MKNIKRTVAGLVLLLFAFGAAGAAARHDGASEKFDKTYPLSSGGTVSLQNVNGNLKVMTWNRNEVRVRAVKHADDEESLVRLRIEVETASNSISIRTKYPDNRDGDRGRGESVDYELTVPKDADLDNVGLVNGNVDISELSGDLSVSTVNGAIRVSGVSGSCDLATVNGKVDVSVAALQHDSNVRLKSVNGALTIRLPARSDADVKASTTMGRITDEFGLGSLHQGDRDSFVRIGAKLSGKVGSGGSPISLHTVNGSISILKGN